MGERIYYIRVSSKEQNLERQRRAMEELSKKEGFEFKEEHKFEEKISGKNMDRPELLRMLDYVREGDTVYISDFSRLSRSLEDLLNILNQMDSKGVGVVSLKESFDISTPQGKLMLTMLGAINEFEREIIRERQLEGIKIAKEKGLYKGRAPKDLDGLEEIVSLYAEKKITVSEAARRLGITRATFYSRLKKLGYRIEQEKKIIAPESE
ncbi:MAG: recombinase family protein [Lachnospiraceae bacterium]|nr:recombinase family protein [Lachnospiraceae bacterium]